MIPARTGLDKLIAQEAHPDRPDYWILRWSIEGDLRFLSHHNLMRVIALAARRASLPVRYSQGFNPRPVLSLPAPRPVGVSGDSELLVVALNRRMEAKEILQKLNSASPAGLSFLDASKLIGRKTVHPVEITYRIAISSLPCEDLKSKISDLQNQCSWPVTRKKKARRRSKSSTTIETIDLKPMISNIETEDAWLKFTCAPHEGKWAKPAEVLTLMGIDDPAYVSALTRTEMIDDRNTLIEG